METEVIVSMISAFAVITTAFISNHYVKKEKKKTRSAEEEMTLQCKTFDFTSLIKEWGDVLADLRVLMNETNIDRFLILRAFNGYRSPENATAVFQYRESDQEYINYINFKLDKDYVQKLSEIEDNGIRRYKVSEMETESAIRYVYEVEGVTEAVWCFLGAKYLDDKNRALAYCSFCTHSEEGLTDLEITRCRILADRISGLQKLFG